MGIGVGLTWQEQLGKVCSVFCWSVISDLKFEISKLTSQRPVRPQIGDLKTNTAKEL